MNEAAISIFDSAKKYAAGAELLSKQNDEFFHLPAVLCASFGIELLIKCLLTIQDEGNSTSIENTQNFKKHRFTDLFDLLTNGNRKVVTAEYCKIIGTDDTDFRSLLESNGNNAFVDWRYSFEKNISERSQMTIDRKILADITNALGKSVGIIDQS